MWFCFSALVSGFLTQSRAPTHVGASYCTHFRPQKGLDAAQKAIGLSLPNGRKSSTASLGIRRGVVLVRSLSTDSVMMAAGHILEAGEACACREEASRKQEM